MRVPNLSSLHKTFKWRVRYFTLLSTGETSHSTRRKCCSTRANLTLRENNSMVMKRSVKNLN